MTTPHPDLTPSLVQKLRAGNNHAAILLDGLYREALTRFAWGYVGNVEDAADAVQEVFYKVLATREVPEKFRAWIYRVTRNHCLNVIRDGKRRRADDALKSQQDLADSLTGNLTRMEKEEERQRLVEALLLLSDDHQEVLRLRYTEGLSRQEISDVLDIPVPTVKSRLFEVLKKLRLGTDLGGR